MEEHATELNFRETNYSEFDVIQFATHGIITGQFDRVKKPGLALAYPGENVNWSNDGYLSSEEISQLSLDGQLVILSACNTAVDSGSKYNFGLSELSNSFLEAGAKIIREPGPMKHGSTVIAFVEDPDGYKVELIEMSTSPSLD